MADDVSWHSFFAPVHWTYLKEWVSSLAIQPPLLLCGTSHTHLAAASEYIVLLAVCENAHEGPCRACSACRHALRGSHPDISIVGREQYEGGGMATLRTLRQVFSRSGLHGRRLIVLRDVDTLSLPALNALLKALEEPHAGLRYILTSVHPGRLPHTIHSRCSHISLNENTTSAAERAPSIEGLDNFTQRLLSVRTEEALSTETLAYITDALSQQLRRMGPTHELRSAFLRLRDYCHVVAIKGNEKLAREVLFASLPELTHTKSYTTRP